MTAKILCSLLCALPAAAESGRELLEAARSDQQTTVETLLKQGADVNTRDQDGTTALTWAAYRGNLPLAELLLDRGANPNLSSEIGLTPLALAIQNGAVAVASLLLNKGADPNLARENGETPLMTAVRLGQVDTTRLLLDHGAKANVQEKKFHQTPLMWAAGNPALVRMLLAKGADVHARTAVWDVKYTIYAPTTVTLGKTGIPWNTDGEYTAKKGGQNALFFTVQKHDLDSARLLLDAGIDVNQPAADGTTPLLAALYNWDPPGTTFIPGRGAPAPAGSSQFFRPDLALARLFLDCGANATGVDGAGYTALHGAALAVANLSLGPEYRRGGAYGGKAALLTIGAAHSQATVEQKQIALEIVRRLLDAGADPNRQTLYPTPGPAGDVRLNPAPPGSSPLHIAAASRNVDLIRLLAVKGGNPNLVRKDGHTPFSVAVMAGDLEAVKELVTRGADLSIRYNPTEKIPDPVEAITLTRSNQSIMHIAALGGSPEVIRFLHQKGARLDLKNSANETPLQLADHQERYHEAIERQGAEGDAEKLKAVVRKTTITGAIRSLLPNQP